MEYTIGTNVFGGWEIVRALGEGSFGTVFEIQKTDFGVTTQSALKVIRIPRSHADIKAVLSDGMDEQSATSYFQGFVNEIVKEIAVMSTLKSHPNIVSCEDHQVLSHAGEIGWDILIRMELLTSLPDYQMQHTMDEAAVRRLGLDLSSALAFCEKKSLIHRDIKPENIFVSETGQFKLGDFGVARTAEKTTGGLSKKGTESYMAPEVYLGRPYGTTVDIYSLGLVLYKLLNRSRLPFFPPYPQPISFADRENALARRMRGESLPAPVDASPEFAAIILKACAYEPQQRYRTAEELLDALQTVRIGAQPQATPVRDEDDSGTCGVWGTRPAPHDPLPQFDNSTDSLDKTAGVWRTPTKQPTPAAAPNKPQGTPSRTPSFRPEPEPNHAAPSQSAAASGAERRQPVQTVSEQEAPLKSATASPFQKAPQAEQSSPFQAAAKPAQDTPFQSVPGTPFQAASTAEPVPETNAPGTAVPAKKKWTLSPGILQGLILLFLTSARWWPRSVLIYARNMGLWFNLLLIFELAALILLAVLYVQDIKQRWDNGTPVQRETMLFTLLAGCVAINSTYAAFLTLIFLVVFWIFQLRKWPRRPADILEGAFFTYSSIKLNLFLYHDSVILYHDSGIGNNSTYFCFNSIWHVCFVILSGLAIGIILRRTSTRRTARGLWLAEMMAMLLLVFLWQIYGYDGTYIFHLIWLISHLASAAFCLCPAPKRS